MRLNTCRSGAKGVCVHMHAYLRNSCDVGWGLYSRTTYGFHALMSLFS